MRVALWLIIALQTLGAIITITQVGKPRAPISRGSAAFGCLISGAVIIVLLNAIALI
jgi:hypothetical protein